MMKTKKTFSLPLLSEGVKEFIKSLGGTASALLREIAFSEYLSTNIEICQYHNESGLVAITYSIEDNSYIRTLVAAKPEISVTEITEVVDNILNSDIIHLNCDLDISSHKLAEIDKGSFYVGSPVEQLSIIPDDNLCFKEYREGQVVDLSALVTRDEIPIQDVETYRLFLNKKTVKIIAYWDDDPIGLVTSLVWPEPVINYFYCDKNFRGKGIGSLLLKHLNCFLHNSNIGLPYAMTGKKNSSLFLNSNYNKVGNWRMWTHAT